jgi:hypothetical protein
MRIILARTVYPGETVEGHHPAPRIFERHERMSRLYAALAAIGIGASAICFTLLDERWMTWLLSLASVGPLLAAAYRYGWSGRLYRKYIRSGTALSLRRRKVHFR